MTKRALSLLLTLVMVLSLCVPALAAEDFEAEAPAEVVEEAPEAPEAPVAPEAEEPADEPVVDEPAAEEPVEAVADEPEMASVMPEDAEDLPYLVALGKVSKLNHWKLEKTLKTAESYKERVDAGELYVKDSYIKVGQDDSPAKKFLDAYATAQKNLDGINGVVVDIDVTDASVEAIIDELKSYFSTDDGGRGLLTSSLDAGGTPSGTTTDAMTAVNLYDGLKAGASYKKADGTTAEEAMYQPRGGTDSYPIANWIVDGDTKFTGTEWTMAYRSEYLTALKTAQDAIKAFADLTDPEYSDFAKAREAVLAAAKLERTAALPNATDAQTLKDAITAVENIGKKDYDTNHGIYASYDANLFTYVSNAKNLLHKQVGLNGFENNVRYYDANMAIKDLKDHTALLQSTIRFEGYECTGNGEIEVTVSIAKLEGLSNTDGITYGFAFKVGDYWGDITNVAVPDTGAANRMLTGTPNADFKVDDTHVVVIPAWTYDADKYPDRLIFKAIVSPKSKTGDKLKFTSTDKILIQFYAKNVKDGAGANTWSAAKITQNLTFTTGTWFGPTVKKAWVSDYGTAGATTFTYGKNLGALERLLADTNIPNYAGDDVEVTLQMSADLATYLKGEGRSDGADFSYGVLDAKGKGVMVNSFADPEWPSIDEANKKATIHGTSVADDTYLVAGSMTAALTEKVTENGKTGEITRSSASFTINPLSKWSAVKEIKKVLAAAKELKQTDYNALVGFNEDWGYIPGRPDLTSVSAAFQVINDDIKDIETAITSSAVANSKTNRKAVLYLIQDLSEVYNRLAVKPIDVDAINALIAEVQIIKEDDYTYDSFGKMRDALDDAIDAIDGTKGQVLQSKVDEAYAALKAAKDGLVKEGAVDKTALTAAIASAKALVEADYTPDSWAANKPLIDAAVTAAQAVVDNAQATQAQVNTALNTLTAAVAKLEKTGGEDDGPQAPTTNNGTGWVLFENEWYFFKAGKLVANYWVGKIDGASQWDSNWYYVGSDGKMLTGMQYLDDLHGGYGWYFLQPTNNKGEIGKMLTGWQWVGGQYGECYFSKANGSSGKCTWSELLGNWNGTTWVK